jgi:hypothetical protein
VIASIIETASDSTIGVTSYDLLSKYHSRSSDLSMKSQKKAAKKEKSTGGSISGSMPDLRVKRRAIAPSTTQVNYSLFKFYIE